MTLNWVRSAANQDDGAFGNGAETLAIRLGWAIIVLSIPCAVGIVWASGLSLIFGKILPLLFLLPMLFLAHIRYRFFTPDQRISDVTGALAMVISAALLAGLISHAALRLQMPLIDDFLIAADIYLGSGMGNENVVTLFFGLDRFNRLLEIAYESSVQVCMVMILICAARNERKAAWEAASSFAIAILLCSIMSAFIPAVGNIPHSGLTAAAAEGLPRAAGVYHMELWDALRNGDGDALDLGQLNGIVTFPSFHLIMALIFARAVAPFAMFKRAGYAWAALMAVSTIPIGGHYTIDLLAGGVLWLVIIACFRPSKS